MKKIFKLLFILCLVSCDDDKHDVICCVRGPQFHYIVIKETSPEFASFFKETKDTIAHDKTMSHKEFLNKYLDTNNIQLLAEDNKPKKIYNVHVDNNYVTHLIDGCLGVVIQRSLPEDDYDGKMETTFLKNRTKTYKIDALSARDGGEDSTFRLLEVYVNGVKQADSLTKKQAVFL